MVSTTSTASLMFLLLTAGAVPVDVEREESRQASSDASWTEERRRLLFKGLSYQADSKRLGQQIDRWMMMSKARVCAGGGRRPRALVVPHTALHCCGQVAASAFALVNPEFVRRVFLIGPSHHLYVSTVMLSRFRRFKTPFGDLEVDSEIGTQLSADGPWEYIHPTLDLLEHSLENVLPFIGRTLGNCCLVPIVTADLTPAHSKVVADKLAGYLAAEDNLFVISSELSHRGRYYGFDDEDPEETARKMDRVAMNAMGALDAELFRSVAADNNICGELPIDLFLQAVRSAAWNGSQPSLEFLDYKIGKPHNDSYVGCAAAALFLTEPPIAGTHEVKGNSQTN